MAGAMQRALPDFVIVGAQKAGTTSLYSYLLQHPQILPAERKEVHFVDLNWPRGERWYRSHFPTFRDLARHEGGSHGRALTGEASPYYLYHPHTAQRLAEVVPQARIIILLRDPVARAYSHYRHNVRKGEEALSFLEALEREERILPEETAKLVVDPNYRSLAHQLYSYRARGRYAEQLLPFLEHFPHDRILILQSEDLFADPQRIYTQTLGFLDLPSWRLDATRAYNIGRYDRDLIPDEARLRKYYEADNLQLSSLVGRSFGW